MASESVIAESERQPEAKLIAEREKEKTVTRKVRNLEWHRIRLHVDCVSWLLSTVLDSRTCGFTSSLDTDTSGGQCQ